MFHPISSKATTKVIGFCGQFKVNLDPKGRLSLPAKIRPRNEDGSSAKLVLAKGLEGCLALYKTEEWAVFQERLEKLSFTNRDLRVVTRMIYPTASVVEPDKQGRFLIPAHLLEEAGLNKEALVIGANRWIEIWNPDRYKQYIDECGETFEDVADRLLRNDGSGRE